MCDSQLEHLLIQKKAVTAAAYFPPSKFVFSTNFSILSRQSISQGITFFAENLLKKAVKNVSGHVDSNSQNAAQVMKIILETNVLLF